MIGEAGMEAILKATIDTAVRCKAAKPAEFARIIVDATVAPQRRLDSLYRRPMA